MEWLNAFIEYYQAAGAKQIIFLDNVSTDGSSGAALCYKNVSVFATNLPFKDYKIALKQYLLRRFASSCWALLVDIDEFLALPFCQHNRLFSAIEYLNANNYTAVAANLLDMFGRDQRIGIDIESEFRQEDYSWYDLADVKYKIYNHRNCVTKNPAIVARGGIRARAFGTSSILLTKTPLICGFSGIFLLDSHFVEGARIADFTGILLHYKFSGSFVQRIIRAAQEENYYNNSSEYKTYLKAIQEDPNKFFRTSTSRQWTDIQPMTESGFVNLSADYFEWTSRQRHPRHSLINLPLDQRCDRRIQIGQHERR